MKNYSKPIKFVIAFFFLIICSFGFAQLPIGSATWELTNPENGGTGYSASTVGYVGAGDEIFNNTSVNQYTGPEESQRVRISSNEWPANQTSPIEGVYVEFIISPLANAKMYVKNIRLGIAAMSVSTMKAEIQYSTDAAFSTYSVLPYSTGLDNNYLRVDSLTRIDEEIDVTVDNGDTLYLRIYPWVDNDPSVRTGKYVCLNDVIVSGEIESLPYAASVIWPFNGEQSYITTESMLANGPIYSDSLAYYNSMDLPVSGISGTVTTGAIRTVSGTWLAQIDTTTSYYIEFCVFPKYGATFLTDSITLYIGGKNSSNLKAALYYSTDADFSTGTLLINDAPLKEDSVSKWKAGIDTSLGHNDTLYFRIYPYSTVSESLPVYVALHAIGIYGVTSGLTADPPEVTTGEISYISTTFATCSGNIPSDGGTQVITRGVVWNTTGNATINDNKSDEGGGSGSFNSLISGLTPGTTYYVRAYATNGAGTSYGSQIILETLSVVVPPTVSTSAINNILVFSAESGGNVSNWGGDTIEAKGVCWNTAGSPTISDSISIDGSGLGAFTSYLTPLKENTTYYIRAYATNSAGTGYGEEISFTTQSPSPDITKVVAKDGSGDYLHVQDAFDDVPDNYTGTYTILVKPGTYYEKVFLDRNKIHVVLKGIHADSTIITYDDNASSDNGSGGKVGTSGSYSVAIEADDFMAMDITFQNTNQDEQAVALRTNGDRQSFYRCKILGYQDTFYAWGGRGTGRNYFKNCLLEGSVDFIFGRNIVVFDSCEIHENRNNGELTAASTEPETKFGLVFLNSEITVANIGFNGDSVSSFSLGRPWQKSPRTVFIQCLEPAQLKPEGWDSWNVVPALYAEYMCYGPGSDTSFRNPISRQLKDSEASNYTIENIFARESSPAFSFNWIPNQDIYKFSQTIAFSELSDIELKKGSLELSAVASSGLPLDYSSSDKIIATIEGTTVTLLSEGSITITASQEGNYMYNKAPDSKQTLTITNTADIAKILNKNFGVYPNPASEYIVIRGMANGQLSIVNLTGQLVKQVQVITDSQEIDIKDLEKGVYYILVNANIFKLIVN